MFPAGGMGKYGKTFQDMQQKLQKLDAELKERVVEAAAGGGMVKVKVNGKHELLAITIDPSVLKEDVELVQDLVLAAVNEGLRSAQRMVAEEMTKVTGGLKIPGLG